MLPAVWLGLSCLLLSASVAAAENISSPPDLGELARHNEQLKQQAIDFDRDLLLLEDAAVPADRRVTVFVSQSHDSSLSVDTAEIQIDPEINARHSYTAEESAALRHGGAMRLYMGAVPGGHRILSASLSVTDGSGTSRQYSAKLPFHAGQGAKIFEIQLMDNGSDEPEISIHEPD